MKRSPIKKRLGRKRRTTNPIPMLPSRLQDGSLLTLAYHVAKPIIDPPPGSPVDLRQLARGRNCHLPLDGCDSAETVVLAHIRRGHIAGMGQKPPHICAMPMCARHHAMYDGREQSIYTRSDMDAWALAGLCRWLTWLWDSGYLKV